MVYMAPLASRHCQILALQTACRPRTTTVVLGPVRLANTAFPILADRFSTKEQLIEWFANMRSAGAALTFTGALALPPSMNRANIVGFEISRRFRTVTYTLVSPAVAELQALRALF